MTGLAKEAVHTGATGLLCLAGRARIVVPTNDILQVIEYPVCAQLPLAARFVGGLGLFDGRVIISVAIDTKLGVEHAQRVTKGLLVKSGGPSAAAWAIEVSEVRALVEVSQAPVLGVVDHPEKARFVSWRRTRDDDIVGWIDVAAMIAELSQGRASYVAS
jgi:chemotaxis signal transduction protein